jgi:16S rRNA (uracil1498-N3)-methyltransferase
MQYEILASVKEYLEAYPKSAIIDFSENYLSENSELQSFLVGPEGGFSESERREFKNREIYGLKSSNILKSETALVGICAKLAL